VIGNLGYLNKCAKNYENSWALDQPFLRIKKRVFLESVLASGAKNCQNATMFGYNPAHTLGE
jgi:hypothetical protein